VPHVWFVRGGSIRGQDGDQSVGTWFPVGGLGRRKKLKEIRLELSYIPSPFKEEQN